MNLGTIEITEQEATERLAEIEALLRSERTDEDLALAQAYRAAKRGHGVISLKRAFELAGVFQSGRPKLAIVPATATVCRVRVAYHRDSYIFDDTEVEASEWQYRRLVGQHHVRVAVDPAERDDTKRLIRTGTTIVPSIPPRHRPKPSRLKHCHILWEVEKWDPTPPVDPALVRHIRGDLWAVLATWDLTELERLVLTQRA